MNVRRPLLALAMAIGAVLMVAAPALAQISGSDPRRAVRRPHRACSRSREATTVSDAVIFNGDATIPGDVDGQVIAFNGDVTVSGTVAENVVSLNGHVTLLADAHVGGDIASRFAPDIAPTATFDGRVRSARSFDVNVGRPTAVSRILVWLATTVSSFLLGLLLVLFVPRAAEAVARTATAQLGASIGFGLPDVHRDPDRRVHRDRRPAGDPARRRRAAGPRPPLLARLHGRCVRARTATGLRPEEVDARVPRRLGRSCGRSR